MSLHAVLVVGRYQESGQDRAVLASAWETEIKVTLGTHGGRDFRFTLRRIFEGVRTLVHFRPQGVSPSKRASI